MEGLQRMNDSLHYIEGNLDSTLQIEEIAKIACMSKFHFQRMFQMVTGFTVAEYIRKRKLTLAAQELIHANVRVIDVALKYGYESPESFSKAFRKAHGISPIEVRKTGSNIKAFPKLSFQIQLKGEQEMNYKIVHKDEFIVSGKGTKVTMGENNKEIPLFWNTINRSGLTKTLATHADEMGLMGICLNHNLEQEEMTYFIGVEKISEKVIQECEERTIPASTWAVFEVVGPMPHSIQNVWKRIFSEWFPSTGYEHGNGPEIEVYPDGDAFAEDYRSEVWVPIMKK
ncbi:AraC family transcriptional regulator [Metabacillus litoralis]|uniref:AraC family transcriptional regulator n=1 Tax=Metabacillus litoralis TaxID=152268 RepID=UPI001CFF5192|nr:AraC family transcriptional regulator [Metabacillus litoralis]